MHALQVCDCVRSLCIEPSSIMTCAHATMYARTHNCTCVSPVNASVVYDRVDSFIRCMHAMKRFKAQRAFNM
jgi:hypothetical protein